MSSSQVFKIKLTFSITELLKQEKEREKEPWGSTYTGLYDECTWCNHRSKCDLKD